MVKSYCIREKKQTDSTNEIYEGAKNGRLMLKSISANCGAKKSKFIKNQEGGFLSDMLFKLGAKGLYNGAKLAASQAIKSDFMINKFKGMASKYLDQALDSVTADIRNKLDPMQDGAFDIHKVIGKLPKPASGWVSGFGKTYKFMGPYNPLDKQLEYDNEGNITKWHVQPYKKLIVLQRNMTLITVCVQTIRNVNIKLIVKWFNRLT